MKGKDKMKNKIVSLLFAGAMVLAATVPATALTLDGEGNSVENVEYANEVTATQQSSVDAQVKSSYKVTIPKSIVINGKTKTASYYVKVTGDISDSQVVKVVPANKVVLSSTSTSANKKTDQEGTIVQNKTEWHWDDVDTDAAGTITAEELSAGKWTGKFAFDISVEDI